MNKILLKIVVFPPKIDFCSLAACRSINYLTLKETLTLLTVKILQIEEKGVTKSSRIDGCVRNEKYKTTNTSHVALCTDLQSLLGCRNASPTYTVWENLPFQLGNQLLAGSKMPEMNIR